MAAIGKIAALPLEIAAELLLSTASPARTPITESPETAEQLIAALLTSDPSSSRAREIEFLARLGVIGQSLAAQLR